ncbi:hypothetical protein ACFY19_21125 [Streptosporangium saharense]|uniref:hypothetical protein n=1 Tax=Streptosporangium saharense TaxID=1706840 RepID=UPI00367DCB36
MRTLFTRLRRPATGLSTAELSGVTFDEPTSQVCDLDCRADAAVERTRTSVLLFR